MAPSVIIYFCVSALLSPVCFPGEKGWRGIVPLHSTRSDVEKLFGRPSNQCMCAYYSEDVNVFVVYAAGDCKNGGTAGWNVPPDTVIRFDVVPKKERSLSKLGMSLVGLRKMDDPEVKNAVYYVDDSENITIALNKVTNEVQEIHYGPTVEDSRKASLRCP